MNAAGQFQMFEPEGAKLVEMVVVHSRNANFERRVAVNLQTSGYASAAASRVVMAQDADDLAGVCETALQFEQLAGLS